MVFVGGLQKSGTTLLLKLLTTPTAFRNPLRFEGKDVWGDDPRSRRPPTSPDTCTSGRLADKDTRSVPRTRRRRSEPTS